MATEESLNNATFIASPCCLSFVCETKLKNYISYLYERRLCLCVSARKAKGPSPSEHGDKNVGRACYVPEFSPTPYLKLQIPPHRPHHRRYRRMHGLRNESMHSRLLQHTADTHTHNK